LFVEGLFIFDNIQENIKEDVQGMRINADTLRKIRIANKLTQSEIGTICGVSESMINKVERNTYPITDKINDAMIREFQLGDGGLMRILSEYERITERKSRLRKNWGGV
jgi:transcriptional regulator with XRE-family HTH domain